jgi:hypothetical protein
MKHIFQHRRNTFVKLVEPCCWDAEAQNIRHNIIALKKSRAMLRCQINRLNKTNVKEPYSIIPCHICLWKVKSLSTKKIHLISVYNV